MARHILALLSALLPVVVPALSAGDTFDFANSHWPASWIAVPEADPQGYGVYHFRKTFSLDSQPAKFIIYVSGDNGSQLYVNALLRPRGRARSHIYH